MRIFFLQFAEERKQVLWDLFQQSLDESILVHCKKGKGRTGHLIFMFEILKNITSIFASNDPEVIADRMHAVLSRIRENRPVLVTTENQFVKAIRNAVKLYHFALDKKYVTEGQPLYRDESIQKKCDNMDSSVMVKKMKL